MYEEKAPRFLACTVLNWIPLFTRPATAEIVLDALRYRQEHKRDRQYQCWEEGSHPVLIGDEAILRQKLEYIHQNPDKHGYVDDPTHWRYSSARNYAGLLGLIPVFTEWA